jgi:hypothetical protein
MRKIVGLALAAGTMALFSGCGDDGTGPGDVGAAGLFMTYVGGGGYEASGMPSFNGNDVAAGTFAIAFEDSIGGLAITSFEQTEGTRGNLFILQLTDRRTGTFSPCGVTQECHGRLLEGIDADSLQVVDMAWEIAGGSVQVDDAGPTRVTGSFSNLVLQAQDTTLDDRTVESGTFDLLLLPKDEGEAIMRCFLKRATGAPSC